MKLLNEDPDPDPGEKKGSKKIYENSCVLKSRGLEASLKSRNHGLINYKETKTKCRDPKKIDL
jgi:hypothetical protein